ncbi:hypothetical protein OF83DRAFT_45393 [Amylostereum chailletii]|nr:hypothetical protein OF83DRAFT_45393 [Amylostereum chailletii]
MSLVAAPYQLWRWYVDYLWYYERDSWVASTASTFRILAAITLFPGIVLVLLDVASYVIARTLGDPTASTSSNPPRIVIETEAVPSPFFISPEDGEDDGTARLAGAGVFSPAPSQPGSPVATRKNLARDLERYGGSGDTTEGEQEGSSRNGDTSGDESFAMLERDESFEDAGLHMRRRGRPLDAESHGRDA